MEITLKQKLTEFRQQFVQDYPDMLAKLVKLWQAARVSVQVEPIAEFLFELNKMKGATAALNFLNLSDRLAIIEQELEESKHAIAQLSAERIRFVDRHINALANSAKKRPDPVLRIVQRDKIDRSQEVSSYPPIEVLKSKRYTAKDSYHDIHIALVDSDVASATALQKLLDGFGFKAKIFNSMDNYLSHTNPKDFNLVLLEVDKDDDDYLAIFVVAAELVSKGIAVFILSNWNSFEPRLLGVRAEVSEYLLKPVDIASLVSKIRSTFNLDTGDTYKLIVLDDQKVVGEFYKALFENKGIEVKVYTDAVQLMDELESFYPDAFLLDMHMPDINGLEVAKVIRQQSKYNYVPIIFLTADTDMQIKLNVLQCGADDVIHKDTSAGMIVEQVQSRIERGQEIRYLASRDSLTGILNHGQIMDAAGQAFRLAQRHDSTVVIAMVDLDNFKEVNDECGHSCGDKVLLSVAQLILNSIRDTDYVGRYGGEEFMVVFGDGQMDAIESKMQDILDAFNKIEFSDNDRIFHCSFSAGLCSSADFDKLSLLIGAADRALYRAKDAGKNQICINGKD
ncbi:diguanylate cyclase [Aliiglaciecola sp. LCG003]|uniref:diguanylate cyclase n=1 Tax=Aliiglaciecola sp. LCG003 TaxID=3053655 RepID=UPI0025742F37|nr:diguanylate cyclase [Aliiglaciecola sp. LCG003]WJG09253.1 diguanylate cyclase [Aliiglaciecola sp. LCG003]